MSQQLLFLELNEVNFEYILAYANAGKLPTFQAFLDKHGYAETTSEKRYEELEPWIQWVTAHTGLTFEQHGVFRLGDIVRHEIPQIWEMLEERGYSVGAISPMNAKHRLKQPAFFIPDPWTRTALTAPGIYQRLYAAIAQMVNDNAQTRFTAKSAIDFAFGGLFSASVRNYGRYFRYLLNAKNKPWLRAVFLDLLLSDLFHLNVKRTNPQFATLFLNAAAHIQHHYMFSSTVYDGPHRNPDWYIETGEDPLLDVYQLYDSILADTQRRFPEARLMIATALHQDPHTETTFYWRLRDHAEFLHLVDVPFVAVEPRMSRDFLVMCRDPEQAYAAARVLELARAEDGTPLFDVDNRGNDLFVMLTYPHDIRADAGFTVGEKQFQGLRDKVAFVAIKNGRHNGIGYFADSGVQRGNHGRFPLKDIPHRIASALGTELSISFTPAASSAA